MNILQNILNQAKYYYVKMLYDAAKQVDKNWLLAIISEDIDDIALGQEAELMWKRKKNG